jgi:hypothetical protein
MKTAPNLARTFGAAFTVLWLCHLPGAHAEEPRKPCSVSETKAALGSKSPSLAAAVQQVKSTRCSTFEIVLRRFVATQTNAGRKLEPTASLDMNASAAQLKAARENPEFQAALAQELNGVTDETVKALLEIALLDDMDYNNARDLRLLELRKEAAK